MRVDGFNFQKVEDKVDLEGIEDLVIGMPEGPPADTYVKHLASRFRLLGSTTQPVLTNNQLIISQGQAIILGAFNLNAVESGNGGFALTFTVSHVQHGYFAQVNAPTIPILNFSLTNILNGEVLFIHDGTANPPSYQVSVSDGVTATPAQASIITFNLAPVIIANQLLIQQGQTVTLSSGDLSATISGISDSSLLFTTNYVQNGYFNLNQFTQAQIQTGQVQFSADGSFNPPSYAISVSDKTSVTAAQPALITFKPAPLLVNNTLKITALGQSIVLTSSSLDAIIPGSANALLNFTVNQVQHGYFSFVTSPTVSITYFSEAQIQKAEVQFTQDGSNNVPSFNITATDGLQSSSSQSGRVLLNLSPLLVNNRLSIQQGKTVLLTPNDLAATDPDDPAENLIFTVSDVSHGAFTVTADSSMATLNFTQGQIQTGAISFISDGGPEAPSYKVAVSDGFSTTTPASATISFSATAAVTTDATVDSAIIGGSVSGGVGLLFFFFQLYLKNRTNQKLQKKDKEVETAAQKEQMAYHRNIVQPITEKLFEQVDTTYICGYRSEKNSKLYEEAIENVMSRIAATMHINLETMQVALRTMLINEVINQIKLQTKKHYRCCTRAHCSSFFKPQVNPEELEDATTLIANGVCQAVSCWNKEGLPRSPTSSTSGIEFTDLRLLDKGQQSSGEVEMATVSV